MQRLMLILLLGLLTMTWVAPTWAVTERQLARRWYRPSARRSWRGGYYAPWYGGYGPRYFNSGYGYGGGPIFDARSFGYSTYGF